MKAQTFQNAVAILKSYNFVDDRQSMNIIRDILLHFLPIQNRKDNSMDGNQKSA